MATREALVELARRHVLRGQALVDEQRARIERMRALGLDTAAAERVLATLCDSLELMWQDFTERRTNAAQRPG